MKAKIDSRRAQMAKMLLSDQELLSVRTQRVGTTPRERLAWAVRVIQRRQRDLTPGDWENIRLELAGFIWPRRVEGAAIFVDRHGPGPFGVFTRPTEEQARAALARMGEIIEAAVKRQEYIPVLRVKDAAYDLRWDPESSIWVADWFREREPSWRDVAAVQLGQLLEKVGALLKECPAPAVRGAEGETCGEWFVAKRPNQDYCSATCQSRASTRAKRAGTPTPAALKRREQEKEG